MNAKNNSTAIFHTLVWVSLFAFLGACSDSDSDDPLLVVDAPAAVEATAFKATVYRTEGGIPHISAEDFGSLGFGTGYAAAQDNFCILARNLLKYRAQLSEFIGPDDGNPNTDFFYKMLIESGQYDEAISPELDAMIVGYAAGFNRYLRDTGIDNLPDPECRGAQWIQQMSAEDVQRIHLTPAFLPNFARLFVAAAPPVATASAGSTEKAPTPNKQTIAQRAGANKSALNAKPAKEIQPAAAPLSEQEKLELVTAINDMATARDKGSNGVAIGRDLTAHQGGILYTNPHLDWGLQFRFYPSHQIIPGVTNLLGATSFERVNVGFGTNGDMAWTNTVTASRTSALYELELAPGNPLAYMFDGEVEDIEQIEVSVNVLGSDGQLTEESHTFYKSRHGLLMGLIFNWDASTAFALRIADEGARGQNGGAIAFSRAKTVRELRTALNQFQSSANTNTIATDSNGEAFYANVG
ncbi:MAG: penicillin acylase family protein, partial [Pseudomonadales bacterium]